MPHDCKCLELSRVDIVRNSERCIEQDRNLTCDDTSKGVRPTTKRNCNEVYPRGFVQHQREDMWWGSELRHTIVDSARLCLRESDQIAH